MNAWRCSVCGYVHRQPDPPEWCPVCGSPEEEFKSFTDEVSRSDRSPVEQWRCLNCNHIHQGARPPEFCPVCNSPADRFEPLSVTIERREGGGSAAKVVIVGAGIAGIAAAESLRSVSPEAEITLISKESALPYYRLNLTRYLANEISESELPIYPETWYHEQNINLRSGTEVSSILLDSHTLELCGGDKEKFEKLILAIGAHPFLPPFPGVHREGVTSLRSLDHVKRILAMPLDGAKCICIGGGLLGLEAAGAVASHGADVTLLEGHGWLLPRQLNRRAGEILEQHTVVTGITLRKHARTSEILGDERVRGVLLEDNTTLAADLVIIATGVRPNSYLARLAGLEVNKGVVVDNHLMSSHPDVLAAGDVAEHRGVVYGIWGPSRYQGNIAGINAGGLNAEFGGIPRSNTLKVLGFDLFSIGQIEPEDASFDVIEQEMDGKYLRFVFRDNYLIGTILLGDTELTTQAKSAIEKKIDFSKLLKARPTASDIANELREKSA